MARIQYRRLGNSCSLAGRKCTRANGSVRPRHNLRRRSTRPRRSNQSSTIFLRKHDEFFILFSLQMNRGGTNELLNENLNIFENDIFVDFMICVPRD